MKLPTKQEKNSFAGNKVSKIEIGLAATQNQSAAQTSPITTISLGVLRQKVKPARYNEGVLYQSAYAGSRSVEQNRFYLHEVEIEKNLADVFKTSLNTGTPAS